MSPDLSRALTDYAEIYRSVYGQREKVEELIPYMLEKFLDGDGSFKKARKELLARADSAAGAAKG